MNKPYVMDIEELKRISGGVLGIMTEHTYAEFKALADQSGVPSPVLVLEIKFKPGAHDFLENYPYPISEMEWQDFLDTLYMCEYVPPVHVCDGSLYNFPI